MTHRGDDNGKHLTSQLIYVDLLMDP